MKHLNTALFLLLCAVMLTANAENDSMPLVDNINKGELLTYDITFGWFNVGSAHARIADEIQEYDGTSCIRFDVFGETKGIFKMVSKVKDEWTTYCELDSLRPVYAYRHIREGRHTKEDKVFYHQEGTKVEYQRLNKATKKYESQFFESKDQLYDLLGGVLYLRQYDFDKISVGDSIGVKAFYNRKFYDFKVFFEGRTVVKTKLGKVHALQLRPELPANKIFSGKNAIRLWLSDDQNKLPLRFEVEMLIGSAGIEIKSADGLKNDVNFVKK
jgi:hypothetical protein